MKWARRLEATGPIHRAAPTCIPVGRASGLRPSRLVTHDLDHLLSGGLPDRPRVTVRAPGLLPADQRPDPHVPNLVCRCVGVKKEAPALSRDMGCCVGLGTEDSILARC